MATLHASSSALRGAKQTAPSRIAASGVSSLRFKPFTQLSKASARSQQRVYTSKAAETEAPAAAAAGDDLDFEFNLNESKRNNDYTASDVEAALRFFNDGEGAGSDYDRDFVSNPLGTEDASYFDDIDNNEAYEADEYIVAGIPEAAPKKRGRGRRQDGAGPEAEDEMEQAKALDKMKALEDQMVLEAALEDEFGTNYDTQDKVQLRADKPGMWDWLTDFSEAADAQDSVVDSKMVSSRRSNVNLASDAEVMSGLGNVNIEELDQETRDLLELVVGEGDLTEEELKGIQQDDDAELPDLSPITSEQLASLDAVLAKDVEKFTGNVDVELPMELQIPPEDEGEFDGSILASYIKSIKSAGAADSDVSEDEVKAMFAADGEALELEGPEPAEDDSDDAALLNAAEPKIPSAQDLDFNEASELLITADEEGEYEVRDIKRELQSLAAMAEEDEDDMPTPEQLDVLEQYLSAAEEYVASEDARKADIAQSVARGELSVDALAEQLEEVPDMEAELLEGAEEDTDFDAVAYDDEEEDNEQWVERIIELTRVTKVVKGGKIMGFRCTAIVGNQNGLVGVGCQAGREVAVAVKRTLVDAKKNIVRVPLVGAGTIPHKSEAKYHAARAIIVPASDGTGVIAGGSIRSVLELAGVQNVLGKRLGCRSALNNARATVKALQQLKTLNEVSKTRGIPMDELLLPQ